MITIKSSILTLVAFSMLAGLTATADDVAAGRKIFAEKQDSVIWVAGIAKMSFSAPETSDSPVNIPDEEVKVDALATLVDTHGLAVASLSQIDPARAMNGRSLRTSKGSIKVDAISVLKEIHVIMADGTEIPAELVMKDVDLDLAVIRIDAASKEAKGVTFRAVDLKDSASGEILDPVITITRMDELFNRVANVTPGHIDMVTKKPRVFLRAAGATGGCPTFSMDGKIIGITSGRLVPGKQPAAALLPAADILEIVQQAAQVKTVAPEATKPAAPKTEAPVELDK